MSWSMKWILSNIIGLGIAMPIGSAVGNWLIDGPYKVLQTFLLFSGPSLIYGTSVKDYLIWPAGLLAIILLTIRVIHCLYFNNNAFAGKWLLNAILSFLLLVIIVLVASPFLGFLGGNGIPILIVLCIALWTTTWLRSRFLKKHVGHSYIDPQHAKGFFVSIIVIFGFVLAFNRVLFEDVALGAVIAYALSGMIFGLIYGFVTRQSASELVSAVQEWKPSVV